MTIELLKPHTHAGVVYAPGDRLDLDEAAARWLIDAFIATAVVDRDEPTIKPKPTSSKGD
jgi:hypothetical protein